MKKILLVSICLALVFSLYGCSGKPAPIPETESAAALTEQTAVPTETAPVPTEPEAPQAFVMAESYYFTLHTDDAFYQRYITFYPGSGFYDARVKDDPACGSYTLDGEGRIAIKIAGQDCVFKKEADRLVLVSGSFPLCSDSGTMDVVPGTGSSERSESALRAGIYRLDTTDFDFTFGDVLLDLDLANMTFTLKCFDGSLVSGTLHFEENLLICTHAGGKMMMYLHSTDNGLGLQDTSSTVENGSILTDQLMFCPPLGHHMQYTFMYAEDQEQTLAADPEVIPLDSSKHVFQEVYEYRSWAETQNGRAYSTFNIYHYPFEEKWEFMGAADRIAVTAEENPDGSIVFSHNGNVWNFHREADTLHFDGGSALTARVWYPATESKGQEAVPTDAVFLACQADYLYDATYILPDRTMNKALATIQIDTAKQHLRIRCYDGNVLDGTYIYNGIYFYFPLEVVDPLGARTIKVALSPIEHTLRVGNEGFRDVWSLLIGPGELSDTFDFIPAAALPQDADTEEAS